MKAIDFLKRYQKQITLPQIGEEGQLKLANSHVAIIGCGGLGSLAAVYLAGAGIGKITLVDHDYPGISNLHRQVFFNIEDKASKAEQLKAHIQELNNTVQVYTHEISATKKNIVSIITDADVVLDCTDDLHSKYLINDACVLNNKAFVYASIHQTEGYAFAYNPKSKSAHLRNFFPQLSEAIIPNCNDVGVYNILAGMFGLIQANEAFKLILGLEGGLENKLMIYNALNYSQQFITSKNNSSIDVKQIWESEDYKLNPVEMIQEIEVTQLDEFLKQEKNLEVISLLEEWEDELPIANATRLALGDFNEWTYKFKDMGKYLVYCWQGNQSKLICDKLNKKHPNSNFYTLKGGIQAKKINAM